MGWKWMGGMSLPPLLQSMYLKQATRWTCPRRQWLTTILTPRHTACWSPGTSNNIRPLSTEKSASCQDSMQLYRTDIPPTRCLTHFRFCVIWHDVLYFRSFYFQYAPRPHMAIRIYTPLLVVPLFTDEGSRRLPKGLICLWLIWLVSPTRILGVYLASLYRTYNHCEQWYCMWQLHYLVMQQL